MTNVCITGIGVITSVGEGKDAFWENILKGVSGISEISSFDTTKFSVHKGGEIKSFFPDKYGIKEKKIGRCSQLAIAAADLAYQDANLGDSSNRHVGVVMGTTMGEGQILENLDSQWVQSEANVQSSLIAQFPADNIANNIKKHFNLNGMAIVIPNACAAGNFAIAYGYELIKQGEYDIVLVGGAEAMSKIAFIGFSRIFAIAPENCQPFDKNRKGIMVGEGAAVLVLEKFESAINRKAKIYGFIGGYGLSADASHMMIPDQQGIFSSMERALKSSSVKAEDIDYICAHGTGTVANDLAEAKAITQLFEGDASNSKNLLVSSIKSMLGHTMGAASAIEAVACVLSIATSSVPPTINLENQDPNCLINVPRIAWRGKINTVLNNAFAFGGNNACVVFSREKNESQK